MLTNNDLSGMDLDLIFQKDNHLVVITTNGEVSDKFLVAENDQETLMTYLETQSMRSEYQIQPGMEEIYPDLSSFTNLAQLGLYFYDMVEGVETLVVEPISPLLVSDLPADLQKLLPNF